MKNFLSTLFLILISYTSFGQIESKDIPYAFSHKIDYAKIEPFFVNGFDKEKLLDEDRKASLYKSYAFAKSFDANISFDDRYIDLNNGYRIFYKKIVVPNSDGIALVFDNYQLLDGEKIFVFDNSHNYLIGAFTNINNKDSKILPTRFIPEDTIVVEFLYKNSEKHEMPIIKSVAAAYRDLNSKSEWCEININCDDDNRWQTVKKAVVKITFESKNDRKYYVCSGSLIANTKQDDTPYFITANHCISTEDEANSAVFYFNYESVICLGSSGDESQTVAGATLKATADYHLDFSLLLLSKVPPELYSPYYVGWDRTDDYKDTSICIHHPDGDIKKISKDYNHLSVSSFAGYDAFKHWNVVDWDEGSTEGGSSGSGLFTTEGLLIGTLSGGFADCDNDLSDQFQQFYHNWDDYNEPRRQVNYWLDPFNFDPPKMNGYFPYKNINLDIPLNFEASLSEDSVVTMSWEQPFDVPDKYIIYKNLQVFDEVSSPQILYDNLYETGVYVYYATAIYSGEESKPSEMKSLVLGDTSTVPKITEITVYPNPSSGNVTIISQDTIPLTKIEVYDNFARKIKTIDILIQNEFSIDLSEFETSQYILKIYTKGDIYYKKIIIVK